MSENFSETYWRVNDHLADTLIWLCHHQDCFDSFHYDTLSRELTVHHANGSDLIRPGQYLNAAYGVLVTS
ncbi:hypothetical protein [Acinetobacter sp. WZC-1]|uniref:hypothetical protein n=1 Tax=Acinetobacter sp. WZC-1 TaxID=3459034 RepID=UPI00403D97FC